MDRNTALALSEGYRAIAGKPLVEGIFSWLFGSSKKPSEELADRINKVFDRFYDHEFDRSERNSLRMGGDGYSRAANQAMLDRFDTVRRSVLSEVAKYGKQLDKACKERDKAYKTRDSYSDKLDYMRDSRDDYRNKFYEQKRKK